MSFLDILSVKFCPASLKTYFGFYPMHYSKIFLYLHPFGLLHVIKQLTAIRWQFWTIQHIWEKSIQGRKSIPCLFAVSNLRDSSSEKVQVPSSCFIATNRLITVSLHRWFTGVLTIFLFRMRYIKLFGI